MRKMLVAMAKDLRVLIIKLADRLHNMRTIAAMPAWKQERTAQETLDIYAPLAHRLGMQELKQQLEDLSFAALHPKRYAEIDHMVASRTPERDIYLTQVLEEVRERLQELRINAEVTGRPKHLWSIYEKMVVKGREFDDIFDLVGIRVIVETVKDCYAALGSIHATWKPVQGRFKDYIAMPKFNLYQSLHTTVVGPQGKPLEVQIRTREMHQRAEFGVAAHWNYKDNHGSTADLAWLNRIVDWQTETSDPDRVHGQPEGRPRAGRGLRLHPEGPGHHPAGGRHAGRLRLRHPHRGRPRVHRRPGQRPPGAARLASWRRATRSRSSPPRSRAPARRATGCSSWPPTGRPTRSAVVLPRAPRGRHRDRLRGPASRRCAARACRCRRSGSRKALDEVADELNYADLDALYAAIGEHHVSAKSVAERLRRHARATSTPPARSSCPPRCGHRGARHQAGNNQSGVHVEGLDDVMVRLSRCCTPVPGDEIMGFVTRGRGVSVHRADCANAVSLADRPGRPPHRRRVGHRHRRRCSWPPSR